MGISEELSETVNKLIEIFLLDSSPDPLDLRSLATRDKVLPLLIDMSGVFTINMSGDVVSFTFDNLNQPKIESDPRIRNIVIFQGSQKYPELKCFVPLQPYNAQTCPFCNGDGIAPLPIPISTVNAICYCGGLGWIP